MSVLSGPINDAEAAAQKLASNTLQEVTADLTTLVAAVLDKADDYKIKFSFEVSLERKVPVGPVQP